MKDEARPLQQSGSGDQRLRLKLDAPTVLLPKLVSAASVWASLVQEVSKQIRPKAAGTIEWAVEVERGSITLAASPQADPDTRQRAIEAIAGGLLRIEERAERPPHFTEQALAQARALANLASDDMPIMVVGDGQKPTRLTSRLVANVDELTGEAPPRIGTIEGHLEAVNVHGKRSFAVWERLTGTRVECYPGEDITVEELGDALGRRVAVRGRIRASKTGAKRGIYVTQLRVFPSEDELPTADEVRGILKAS